MSIPSTNVTSYQTGVDVQPTAPQRGGCWKYGAIGCAVALVLAVVVGIIAFWGVRRFVTNLTEQYTATTPMELPRVEAREDEGEAVVERVDAFTGALKHHGTPQPLVLTARDINILINRHPDWKALAGKVFVSIEDDKISGQTSIPLDGLGKLFAGRYLNGSASFRVEMTAGRLLVFIESVTVGGEPLPEELVNALKAENLAKDVNKQPESRAVLQQLESITVRDGRLTIVPKARSVEALE